MALDSKNNIKSVFIVPAVTPSPAVGTKITPGSTTLGWVGITNMSNEVLDTSTTNFTVSDYSKIKIIKDRGADLPLQQVVLNLSDIANTSAYSGAIASEQSSYIGYDGTSGTIASTALDPNTFYEVKLEHVPNQFAYGKRPANYKYGTWQSGATAPTEIEVVTNIVKSLIQNFVPNRTTDWRVKSEVVASGTGVLVTTSLDANIVSITFNKYSKTAVVTTNGAVSAIAANTYIRVGAGISTTTNPIVKVVSSGSVAGAGTFNIVLDYAWQGDSGAVLAADLYTVATLGNVGIKITGIKQKYDVNRWRQYDKVRFNPFVNSAFTSTPVSTVAAFDGVAVYEQAANDEYISWGDEGQIFVDQVPPLFREQDAVVGTQYNPVVISWLNRLPSLIGAGENKGQVILYMAGGDGIGDFTPTLNQLTFVNVFDAWVPTNLELGSPFPDPTV
jgi:hypothetical protein